MPERAERFLWLYGSVLSSTQCREIDAANERFEQHWQECPLSIHRCVADASLNHQVWLFRLGCGVGGDADRFSQELTSHLNQLRESLRLGERKLWRRTNMPTPLLCRPSGGFPVNDIGLHAVNDAYNGMLVTYSYYKGQFLQPAHLQPNTLRKMVANVTQAWHEFACNCHYRPCPECGDEGCWDCFAIDCSVCQGTGWKGFSRWMQQGFGIDYRSGFPIAVA
jgi:hypothetical protein